MLTGWKRSKTDGAYMVFDLIVTYTALTVRVVEFGTAKLIVAL
jgi:hypothetical protein